MSDVNDTNDLYKASIKSFKSTINFGGGESVGFVVPEYQRTYDWSKGDIERLLYDSLTGLARLDKQSTNMNASDFTFLGSVIVVESSPSTKGFTGISYDIVDGQQRLTTLVLCACALSIKLRFHRSTLDKSILRDEKQLDWLIDEVNSMITELDGCAIGTIKLGHGEYHLFPKVVRSGEAGLGDERGYDDHSKEYVSSIGEFLDKFAHYIKTEDRNIYQDFELPNFKNSKSKATKKIKSNYKIICNIVDEFIDSNWYKEKDFDQLKMKSLPNAGYEKLFNRTLKHFEQGEVNGVLTKISKIDKLKPLIQTLLLSSYLHSRAIFTLIKADDQFAAFDMFDSLNTTGQPLTALETLRPRVVAFEIKSRGRAGYSGSPSETAYTKIENHIDEKYQQTPKKQSMSAELVISFVLYLNGAKVTKKLSDQRQELTKAYVKAQKDDDTARLFITKIADLSEFRFHYFDGANGDSSNRAQFHTSSYENEVKLLSSFIAAMNTSLAIPTLFRYWTFKGRSLSDEARFVKALKAITAFIVLRRAATGRTANIDSDLRGLMSSTTIPNTDKIAGNCIGSTLDRDILPVKNLKLALRDLLKCELGKFDKESWISKVMNNPIYDNSQPLAKFMILIAAHKAKPSDKNDGTWTTAGVRLGPENDFYTHEKWKGDNCSTIEHIAPNKLEAPDDWDKDIYSNEVIRHKLGNLTLIPKIENSSMGNQSWVIKRLFYKVAASKDIDEIDKHIAEAAKDKIKLPNATVRLLKSTHRLEILKPIANLKVYDRNTVEARSRNIAELCWDFVRPWLD